MANPYNHTPQQPIPPTTASGPAPKWARKRYVLPALALALFIGVGIGSGDTTKTTDAKPAAAKPQPTVTVTATATAPEPPEPEPAATVTATETVKVNVTRTVTAQPAAGSDDGSSEADTDVYYENCTAVRAAGAAPIHRGEPGYASHLDRDNDGVACDT